MWDMGLYLSFFEYDANATIPLLMMVFEILNPTIQTCASIVARSNDLLKKTITSLVLAHLWKSPHVHLLLGNYLCLGGYSCYMC
jgi:hypothetical protein